MSENNIPVSEETPRPAPTIEQWLESVNALEEHHDKMCEIVVNAVDFIEAGNTLGADESALAMQAAACLYSITRLDKGNSPESVYAELAAPNLMMDIGKSYDDETVYGITLHSQGSEDYTVVWISSDSAAVDAVADKHNSQGGSDA